MDAVASRQTTDYNMVVADNIRAELSRERWSNRQAAIALGVTPNWVNRRMSGETRLDPDDIMLFASFLHVSVADLFVPKTKKGPASEGAGRNEVGLDGLEPPASTVESGRFAGVAYLEKYRRPRPVRDDSREATVTPMRLAR